MVETTTRFIEHNVRGHERRNVCRLENVLYFGDHMRTPDAHWAGDVGGFVAAGLPDKRRSAQSERGPKGKRAFWRTNQTLPAIAITLYHRSVSPPGDARTRPPKPLSTNSDFRRFCVLAGGKGGCGELQ